MGVKRGANDVVSPMTCQILPLAGHDVAREFQPDENLSPCIQMQSNCEASLHYDRRTSAGV